MQCLDRARKMACVRGAMGNFFPFSGTGSWGAASTWNVNPVGGGRLLAELSQGREVRRRIARAAKVFQ
jgi:hypothetical protein